MAKQAASAIEKFIKRWQSASGSERANYLLFVHALCTLFELPTPDPACEDSLRIQLRVAPTFQTSSPLALFPSVQGLPYILVGMM